MTKSFTLTFCMPFILMGARYYYSRKVILNYLECALHTDMADIDGYYMKPTGKGFYTHFYKFSSSIKICHYLTALYYEPV